MKSKCCDTCNLINDCPLNRGMGCTKLLHEYGINLKMPFTDVIKTILLPGIKLLNKILFKVNNALSKR